MGATLQRAIKRDNTKRSWLVCRKQQGKIRIEIKVGVYQSKTLHFDWSKAGFAVAVDEIKQIYKRFYEGETKTLAEACQRVKVSNTNKIRY